MQTEEPCVNSLFTDVTVPTEFLCQNFVYIDFNFIVDLVGLKPTTPRMQIWCSIHLNYKPLKRRDRGSNSGALLQT